MISRGRRTASAPSPEAVRLAELEAFVAALGNVVDASSAGDLEVRMPPPASADLRRVADRFNHTFDLMDAFIRNAQACLVAAADGRYHRAFPLRGMPGEFRAGAVGINQARQSMHHQSETLSAQEKVRSDLAATAAGIAHSVADAAGTLRSSAGTLAEVAQAAVGEADHAQLTVTTLEAASREIENAVKVISQVADQTRLLALNATIEAARAGEAGRGFAVVAGEVKNLANETSISSEDITTQVQHAQKAATNAAEAIAAIVAAIGQIDEQVELMASQVAGGGGLTDLADTLLREMRAFTADG